MKSNYLYVITNGQHQYKIGISNDPQKRLSNLNTSTPRILEICFTALCGTRDSAYLIEQTIHDLLGEKRKINGEWYNLDKIEFRALLGCVSDLLAKKIYGELDYKIKYVEVRNPQNTNEIMLEKAKEVILKDSRASSSFLQRKLSIGYARAARILDQLESDGFVGKLNGTSSREILIEDNNLGSLPRPIRP